MVMDKSDKRRTGPPAPCKRCGEVKCIMARKLCEACYASVMRYGGSSKDRFPPSRPVGKYSLDENSRVARGRALAYWKLTSGTGALGRNAACKLLGITTRTAYRYEAWIRENIGKDKEQR